jgi:pimeloyl-ACP methyl ester carboxylesterase
MIRSLLAAAAAGLLFAAAPQRAEAAEPEFRPGGCNGDYAGVTQRVDCGVLHLDETRGKRNSRRIQIPVAIVRAKAPKGLPPVIFLHGGPGGDAVSNVPSYLKRPGAADLIGADQDWIFLDQRGSGLGAPSMDCPGTALTDAGPPTSKDAEGIVACLDRFRRQGVDLSRYNAIEVARDVQDLRRALKLERIDLYGGSYGTRIAAAIQRHAPQGVRAVVQDSPWPPEGDWGAPEMTSDAIDVILAKCGAQADCARRYPDVKARFAAVVQRFLAGPQTIGGKTYTADDLGGFLMDAGYSNAGVRRMPASLAKIAAGDMSPVDQFMASRDYYFEGQHMAHLCKEEIPFESRRRLAARAAGAPIAQLLVPPLSRLHDVCARVKVGRAQPSEQQPVRTSIPTLFVAAEIDPGCPPHLTRAAARGYARSQVVIVTNATHGVAFNNRCARDMVRAFFADPTKPVNRDCLPAENAPFPFLHEERPAS